MSSITAPPTADIGVIGLGVMVQNLLAMTTRADDDVFPLSVDSTPGPRAVAAVIRR